MTDNNGDGIYEADPSYGPNDYDSFIFCRMNPENDENIWDNCYNQTVDIAYDGTNNYFVPSAPSSNKSTVTSSQYSILIQVIIPRLRNYLTTKANMSFSSKIQIIGVPFMPMFGLTEAVTIQVVAGRDKS